MLSESYYIYRYWYHLLISWLCKSPNVHSKSLKVETRLAVDHIKYNHSTLTPEVFPDQKQQYYSAKMPWYWM